MHELGRRRVMELVRSAVKPFTADGWTAGGSGVRRQDASGHWAHFWFFSPKGGRLTLHPVSGTVAPYLLRTFNRQGTDRAPHPSFIAVHSSLTPLERSLVYVDGAGRSTPLTEHPKVRFVDDDLFADWLAARFHDHLPRLVALSNDDALLGWLAATDRDPSVSELRYAALLARRLGRAGASEILDRAEVAWQASEARRRSMGLPASRRRDSQNTYPQDWTHARFVRFLDEAPLE